MSHYFIKGICAKHNFIKAICAKHNLDSKKYFELQKRRWSNGLSDLNEKIILDLEELEVPDSWAIPEGVVKYSAGYCPTRTHHLTDEFIETGDSISPSNILRK